MAGGRHPLVGLLIAALVLGAVPLTRAAPGVSPRKIRIGVHSPFTGATPLDESSGQIGARLYWRWLNSKDITIHRRNVRVSVRNDNSNPSEAVAVCKELVEEEKVFLLAGVLQSALSTVSATACARYAESVGVPYVGLGGEERPLRNLRRYFAITGSLRDQGRLLADYLVDARGGRREQNGVVFFDVPPAREFKNAFVRALEKRGASLDHEGSLSRNAGTAEARLTIERLRAAGVDNVAVFVSQTFLVNLLKQASPSGYHPLWTGPGITATVDDTLPEAACPDDAEADARFFSPVPAFRDRSDFDRNHDRAIARLYPSAEADEVTWQGWATMKALRRMLDAAGRKLTRVAFVRRSERLDHVRNGILPLVRFRPDDHFGGRGTHVLKMDCPGRSWVTTRSFARDFGR